MTPTYIATAVASLLLRLFVDDVSGALVERRTNTAAGMARRPRPTERWGRPRPPRARSRHGGVPLFGDIYARGLRPRAASMVPQKSHHGTVRGPLFTSRTSDATLGPEAQACARMAPWCHFCGTVEAAGGQRPRAKYRRIAEIPHA